MATFVAGPCVPHVSWAADSGGTTTNMSQKSFTLHIIPTMSLLIPNIRDRADAHAQPEQDLIYQDLWAQKIPTLPHYWNFSPVSGYFSQTNTATDDMKFNYANENFGITKTWLEILDDLQHLNNQDKNKKYKLLFLARHGQGWHNVAFAHYGPEAWAEKWRFLGTDGAMTWGPDANLTELGVSQAKENNQIWKRQLQNGAPMPTRFYVSPMQRSAHTLVHTWKDIKIPDPIVDERLRETIGLHICHKRGTKKEISLKFPSFTFTDSFTEEDEIFEQYTPNRELWHQQFLRVNDFLQELFESEYNSPNEDDLVVSVTSHAGTIRAFISVIGHRKFTISTGGMIPIIVCGERRTNVCNE